MADIVERLRKDKWHVSGVDCETAAQEIERLQAEVTQLRQYLDTAQRRASALGDEVAGLRNQLHLAEVVRASQVEGLNQGAAGWRERANQLEAEVAGLREDAERYRWWLREHEKPSAGMPHRPDWSALF